MGGTNGHSTGDQDNEFLVVAENAGAGCYCTCYGNCCHGPDVESGNLSQRDFFAVDITPLVQAPREHDLPGPGTCRYGWNRQ